MGAPPLQQQRQAGAHPLGISALPEVVGAEVGLHRDQSKVVQVVVLVETTVPLGIHRRPIPSKVFRVATARLQVGRRTPRVVEAVPAAPAATS